MTAISIISTILVILLSYFLFVIVLNNTRLFKLTLIFSLLYFIITVLIYNQNLSRGFENGILFGDVYGNYLSDEFRYFEDSKILYNHFINEGFMPLLKRTLPAWEYIDPHGSPGFGNYNFFVIILALLRLIGFSTIVDFISFKLLFYPITIFFLYKLFKLYLTEKTTIISLLVFSLLPGFILSSTVLMRDSIIFTFIFAALYYILSKEHSIIAKTIPLIILLLILLIVRAYLAPILLATIIFCYKNTKKIFSIKDIIFLIIISLTLLFFTNFKFTNGQLMIFGGFSDEQIRILQENFAAMYGTGIYTIFNVFFLTVIHIFYVPPYINFMSSKLLYLIIFSLGNIVSIITSLIFIPSYLFLTIKNKSQEILYLLKFTFYFTFLSGLMLVSKDGYIITRLSLMWTPLFILIISILIENRKSLIN